MHPTKNMNTVIHRALRRDLDRLDQVVAEPLPAERRREVGRHVGWMLDTLHDHHVSEDEGVWPRALGKEPGLQALSDEMSAEHEALARASDGLRTAAGRYAEDDSAQAAEGMRSAIHAMSAAANTHLDHEEGEAVPRLVEVLDDEDWAYLDKHYFRAGMSFADSGRMIAWITDDLDGELAEVVRTEIPAPVRLVMSGLYGRGYDRAAQLRWGAAAGTRT